MKKFLALILALVMLTTLFVGCGAKEEAPAESQAPASSEKAEAPEASEAPEAAETEKEARTIYWWGGVPADCGPQDTCDAFNEKFADQNLRVEYVQFVNNDEGNLQLDSGLMSGEGVDVFTVYGMNRFQSRASNGMMLALDDLAARDNWDPKEKVGIGVGNFTVEDGKTYVIPTFMMNNCLIANVDMFEEAGVELPTFDDPWTYSEFREAMKKLNKGEGDGPDRVYGSALLYNQGELYRLAAMCNMYLGPDCLYTDATATASNFDADPIVENVQFIQDIALVDKTNMSMEFYVADNPNLVEYFINERYAVGNFAQYTRFIKNLETYPHDFETAYVPWPVSDTYEMKWNNGECVLTDLMAISPNSQYIDDAWEFVKWYNEEGMLYMCNYGRIPYSASIPSEAKLDALMNGADGILHAESAAEWVKDWGNYAYETISTKYTEISAVAGEEIISCLLGEQDAQTAMDNAKVRADAILAGG